MRQLMPIQMYRCCKSEPLGSAYDRAEFMEQRCNMMREWADYLDELRIGAERFPRQA